MARTAYKIISGAIRTRLLTDAALTAIVTQTGLAEKKYYLLAANGAANPPYVRYHHVYGGEPAKAPRREFDQLWLVCSVAFDQTQAMDMDSYVQTLLIGQRLPLLENWESWADITKNGEYANITNIQGQQVWEIGGYYRIRGVKGN